ncbi:MAG: bifunctional N-acetylglucosamine-1-phosphate uridyltransferase/glucosamine-1-phosphate acetyltransferase [Candidatus Omnitrophica bacterium]|nr:bifunctional N-acetylglucosamine-1-phosphate uridyltransferase/glucosamine-1-phosphate acetyltransferase [Candidatus Omnitrophota bacterium]
MRQLHAIILAAGEGTRMKSDAPKVLHPICGRPMIAYALDLAASAGVKQPIVVLGHGAEAVKPKLPKEVKVVIQTKRLGTGDAVLAAKKALGGAAGSVLILYADTPLVRRTTVQKLVESHFKTGASCTLLVAHLADPSGYGRVLRNEQGQITGVVEEGEAHAAQRAIREINVGPLVVQAEPLLAALSTITPSGPKKELYLTDVVSHLARLEGAKIQTARVEETAEALGINSRADLARAIGVIRQRIIDAHLANGVTIEDPQTTSIDHGVTIGADSVIHPHTVIETGVSIGKRCSIGPFARLRSGVTIAEETRVGNFVELVRTKIGPRVRVSHVTYLGDAIVEEAVNIGAGTITANYDGHEKHETRIGKGAFIGSDTVLIAPVKIGAGAVTGAGSVVTKAHDVPPKGVVVGVPARSLEERASAEHGTPLPKGAHRAPAAPARRKPAVARPARRSRPAAARRRTRPPSRPARPMTKHRRGRGAAAPQRACSHRAARRAALSARRGVSRKRSRSRRRR